MLTPVTPLPIITMSALLISLSLHYGNSKAVGIVVIHSKRERYQAWVTHNTSVVFDNASRVLVLWLTESFATSHAVVCNNDAAWSRQVKRPLEILRIRRLVCIDENKIKGSFGLQLRQ